MGTLVSNMKNFIIRCERCGCSVYVGDIKKMERFKELHTTGECFPRKFGRNYLNADYPDYVAMCRALGAEMRRRHDKMFEELYLCHFRKEKGDHVNDAVGYHLTTAHNNTVGSTVLTVEALQEAKDLLLKERKESAKPASLTFPCFVKPSDVSEEEFREALRKWGIR